MNPPSRSIGVTGHSYGGYSTLSLIVQSPRFKAAVMRAGMGDLIGGYGQLAPDGGPDATPDGSTIFFVSTRSGRYEIHSVSAAGGTVTQHTTLSRVIGRPAVAPSGERLYFARTKTGSPIS